jgi:hypothetical protein
MTRSGLHLYETLIERADELGEISDPARYLILISWFQTAGEEDVVSQAFERAQDRFETFAEAHRDWLDVFADLLEFAGDKRLIFAQNLWLAYLFRLPQAAERLWDLYPEIQQRMTIETGRYLPRSWREWILPMQTFMGVVEQELLEEEPVYMDVLTSQDVLDLLEDVFFSEPVVYYTQPSISLEPGGAYDETTLVAYFKFCQDLIGSIDPRGYPRSAHTTVPISDIYVPLRLVSIHDYDEPRQFSRYHTATYDDPEIYAFYSPLGLRELDAETGQMVSEVLEDHSQVLILGTSGAGKTTLLRHLALEYARLLLDGQANNLRRETRNDGQLHFKLSCPLPIYVDLARYVEERRSDESLETYLLRATQARIHDEGIQPLLETMLRDGRCVVLLDGLDQVATDEQRRKLVSRVSEASRTWHEEGNRVVVTSRFAGYDAAPLPRSFMTYLIRPLDRGQISTFLYRWKMTLDRVQRPLIGEDEVTRQAHVYSIELTRQITSNARLQTIINTPLLLRMLVGVYRQPVTFAPQKVAIYQLVSDALIREWQLPQTAMGHPTVLEDHAVILLGELAYWLQMSRPAGLLNEDELEQILGRIWHRLNPDTTPEQVRRAIGDFLGTLRMHAGVLVELAPKQYGFIFHGLQEYFAARYLVSSYRQAAQRIREHLHDPRWSEVILLAVGFTSLGSRENASDLIEVAILAHDPGMGHANSPFESLLKRDLFFAARLLGSGVDASPAVVQGVVKQLMQFWLEGNRDSLGRFSLIYDSARRYLAQLDGTSSSRRGFQTALDCLNSISEYEQIYALDALTFWGVHLPEAQEAITAVDRRQSPQIKRALARSLARFESLSLESYGLLLDLTTDADEQTAALAQSVLENADPVPYQALSLWVDFLHSDDPVRQRVSLRRLQQVGSLPVQVIGELLRLLDQDDPAIRRRAVETLSSASNLSDDAMSAICRAIADSEPGFRAAAINAFARPVALPETVIEQIVNWSGDPDVGVRQAAIRVLGRCKNDDPLVIDALIERLGDVSDSIRGAVLEPLVVKGCEDQEALHMLFHAAKDPIYQVRRAVADAIRHVCELTPELRRVLYTLLSDREMIVRETTLLSLQHLPDPGEEIINYLVSLAKTPDHSLRLRAVQALAAQEHLPDEALLTLLQALPAFVERLGDEIVQCFKHQAPFSQQVLNELMDRAVSADHRDPHRVVGIRSVALEVLGCSLNEHPAALQILIDAASQSNPTRVRIAALHGLRHAHHMTRSLLDLLVKLLTQETVEVRCAAGITLGILIRYLPDPLLDGDDLLDIARELSTILYELPAKSAWEPDTSTQNELHRALSWVVARARPSNPQLPAHSEDPGRYLN